MARRKTLSRDQKARLFLEHGGICHICKTRINAELGETWEVEHVLALEISGRDDWENLRPAHIACHKVKTADDKKKIAKANRVRANYLGIKKTVRRPMPGGRNSNIKISMTLGPVDRRTGKPIRPKGR